jgi:hypothetical protein
MRWQVQQSGTAAPGHEGMGAVCRTVPPISSGPGPAAILCRRSLWEPGLVPVWLLLLAKPPRRRCVTSVSTTSRQLRRGRGSLIGSAGSPWPDSSRQAPMEAARFCHSVRFCGSSGTGPRAVTARGRACRAACSPMRSWQASISAVISVRYVWRVASAMAGTWNDHGPVGAGTRAPVRYRMRASMTAARSRAPTRSRSLIAAARTSPGSRPASSAARRVRHSHRAWWPGSLAAGCGWPAEEPAP